MERFSRTVEREGALVFGHMDVEQYIGIVDAYRWTFAGFVAEVVYNGILYLVGHKLGMAEFVGENHGIDGKTFVYIQIVFPGYGLNIVVDFVGCLCLEVLDGF